VAPVLVELAPTAADPTEPAPRKTMHATAVALVQVPTFVSVPLEILYPVIMAQTLAEFVVI